MNFFRFKESLGSTLTKGPLIPEENVAQTGSVYKKGWLKFVNYDLNESPKLKNFFDNEAYYEQMKRKVNLDQADDYGSLEIPDNLHFFFTLTKTALYIISARRNDIAKTQEVLQISSIAPQTIGSFVGGIEDEGRFKEGFCFKINQRLNGASKVWIICSDDEGSKLDWMNKIAKVKIQQQGHNYALGTFSAEATLEKTFFDDKNIKKGEKFGESEVEEDGKWVILQSWSSCSLACGGGTSTLHRFCVPPTSAAKKPCEGQSILVKSCNTQPCHNSVISGEENLPAKIKMMQISNRPQTYETCVLKEGDLEVVREDLKQFKVYPRIPVRAILNNRTFTVFQAENYDSAIFSVGLKDITVQEEDYDEACFRVLDNASEKHISLCAMEYSHYKNMKKEWIEPIAFFRDHCFDPLTIPEQFDPILPIKKRELEEEVASARMGDGIDTRKLDKLASSLNNMQKMAFDAMTKEMKYEQEVENEEQEREKLKDIELQKKMEEMKEKEECIKRDLNKKRNKDQISMKTGDLSNEINEIRDDIKNLIMKKRASMSKKVEIMKKLANKKRQSALDEIQNVRLKIAAEVMKAQKEGNLTQCNPASPREMIENYCNKHFHDDINNNVDCKDPDEFCYMCCENEFGEFHGKDRDTCFKNCENTAGKGNWVWVPHGNQVNANAKL